jgi:PAS domain S-box-containing protein
MSHDPRVPGGSTESLEEEIAAARLEATSVLIVVLDRDARILKFNSACERATGYLAEEMVGESVFRLIPEDQLHDVEAVFRELRDTGRSSLHENDWLAKAGARRRIAWSNAAVRDSRGSVEQVIGTGIDVSELHASESRRRESELRLAGIVASAMDAIVTADEQQRIVLFNPAAEQMFGRTSAEVMSQPLDILIPEQFRAVHRAHIDRFARSAQTSRRMGRLGRVQGLRANGEEFPVEAAISKTSSESGTLLTAILRDVTEQDRAAETTRLLASIVRSSDDAILGTDRDGRILTWNPAAQEIYGYSLHEIEGESLTSLVPEEVQDALRELLDQARQGRTVGHVETVGLRKDGRRFDVSLGVSPRRDGTGAIAGASVIARDVSERKNLERRLRQTEELAALATLVTGIAHDIGTPMNVILGYTDMLARSLRDEKNLERIRIIKEQVERVTRLIQSLMNFARPQRETPRLLRLEDVAERALGLIGETARKRGITIERAFCETPRVRAQGERLERAFLDLFVNAGDAMPQGGTLRVATRALRDGVEIRIEDTGTGIAPDSLERIFEPFYTTKPRGKGTGLGLLVTRGIVVEHGGTIDVQSELGKGACFAIWLPREVPGGARGDGAGPD